MRAFKASDQYVELVRMAIEASSPNHSPQDPEDFDTEAVQILANYLEGTGYGPGDLTDEVYSQYDLIKWTKANKDL